MTDLQAIIARIPVFRDATSINWDELYGDFANTNYKLTVDGDQYLVRYGGGYASDFGINRHSELEVLEVAVQAGIAPEVIWADTTDGILVSRFIEGTQWTIEQFAKPDAMFAVVDVLHRVHALPAISSLASPYDVIKHRLTVAKNRGVVMPDNLPKLVDRLDLMRTAREAAYPPVLCHGDPFVDNFIVTSERLYLVDWETSCMGDPYFDLTGVAELFDESQREVLLNAYFGHVTDEMRYTFSQMRWVRIISGISWSILQQCYSLADSSNVRISLSLELLIDDMLSNV